MISVKEKLRPIFFIFGTLSLLLFLLLITLFVRTPIPQLNPYIGTQATVVTYSDGSEMGRFASENRIEIPLIRIPSFTQRAVMAAEDKDFYYHLAFSPTAILRAFVNNAQGGDVQGGSTITQQYVKIAYLTQEQSLGRKLKELIIAFKIEGRFTKDEILLKYLNAIYFGRGAYGIETAANQYFDKSASELTVPESIVLASIIRSPGRYDPSSGANNLNNLRNRFMGVKKLMLEKEWISQSVFDNMQFPEILPRKNLNTFVGVTGHIMEEVRKELYSRGFNDDEISKGGLVVRTTIDKTAQDAAEWAVVKETPNDAPKDLHVGLVAIKPGDGAVIAMYGGSDYLERQLNDATQSKIGRAHV